MNAAFRGSIKALNADRPLPCELTILEAEPEKSEAIIKLQELSALGHFYK
jgi:hypothetical protein